MTRRTLKAIAIAAIALFSFAIAPATGTASVAGRTGGTVQVTLTPNPATPGQQLAATGYCEYHDWDAFQSAVGNIDGTDFPLQPDGSPVDVGGGLLRQNLTGALTAPGTPGTFPVTAACNLVEGEVDGGGPDLVVNEPTTTTTTTTTSTPGAPTTTSVPSTTQAPLALTG